MVPYNAELVFTTLAALWLDLVMNASGTACIELSVVGTVPVGGHLAGTTDLAPTGSYLKGLLRQGNPLVTKTTLYWTGTGQA